MKRILILNGPNLNLLGKREPGIYGTKSFEDWMATAKERYPDVDISYYQSNIEGELINKIHEVGFTFDGIILNAGAYTHTSIAIGDAVKAVTTPVLEVHISNIYAREEYRHKSYISPVAVGLITGLGLEGYDAAVRFFIG